MQIPSFDVPQPARNFPQSASSFPQSASTLPQRTRSIPLRVSKSFSQSRTENTHSASDRASTCPPPLLEAGLRNLLLAVAATALADLRSLRARCRTRQPQDLTAAELRVHFAPAAHGHLINSAAFLLDIQGIWDLPAGAVAWARALLRVEREAGWLEELVAASAGGDPWRRDFPRSCMRCGRNSFWKPVLPVPAGLPPEAAWRCERPENHVCLCRRCAYTIGWQRNPSLRRDFAAAVWGLRFEAFERWHLAASAGALPEDWDKGQHPLWPPAYGGETWETGRRAVGRVTVHSPQ